MKYKVEFTECAEDSYFCQERTKLEATEFNSIEEAKKAAKDYFKYYIKMYGLEMSGWKMIYLFTGSHPPLDTLFLLM